MGDDYIKRDSPVLNGMHSHPALGSHQSFRKRVVQMESKPGEKWKERKHIFLIFFYSIDTRPGRKSAQTFTIIPIVVCLVANALQMLLLEQEDKTLIMFKLYAQTREEREVERGKRQTFVVLQSFQLWTNLKKSKIILFYN